jgi:hypothetical protein
VPTGTLTPLGGCTFACTRTERLGVRKAKATQLWPQLLMLACRLLAARIVAMPDLALAVCGHNNLQINLPCGEKISPLQCNPHVAVRLEAAPACPLLSEHAGELNSSDPMYRGHGLHAQLPRHAPGAWPLGKGWGQGAPYIRAQFRPCSNSSDRVCSATVVTARTAGQLLGQLGSGGLLSLANLLGGSFWETYSEPASLTEDTSQPEQMLQMLFGLQLLLHLMWMQLVMP